MSFTLAANGTTHPLAGRSVLYVDEIGRVFPAVVVAAWSPAGAPNQTVNLRVLIDGTNDQGAAEWVTSVQEFHEWMAAHRGRFFLVPGKEYPGLALPPIAEGDRVLFHPVDGEERFGPGPHEATLTSYHGNSEWATLVAVIEGQTYTFASVPRWKTKYAQPRGYYFTHLTPAPVAADE